MVSFRVWGQRRRLVFQALGMASGLALVLSTAGPTQAAQRIRIQQGILEISIPVDALEQFAATGEVPPELRNTLGRLNEDALAALRQRLTFPIDIDVVAMSQMVNSNLGEDYLTRMGNVVRTGTGQNGRLALRAAHVAAAQDPAGVTPLGVIRHFPSDIRISVGNVRRINRQWSTFVDYKLAALEAVQQQAQQEVAAIEPVDYAQLPELRQPGPFRVALQTLTLVDNDRPSPLDGAGRTFDVDLYLPQAGVAAPVVVISHGWGSTKESFAFLAEHLASFGFAVVVPQHIGSDRQFQQLFLSGMVDEDIPPQEYVDRPLDISFTLDELARLSAADGPYPGRMDLNRVGIIGHSLGGYTALAIAGAPINLPLLQRFCVTDRPFLFNLSVYLQCRAAPLPDQDLILRDERVDAAIALNPITSVVQGPSQLGQIAVPTMVFAASADLLATPIQEQIYPFIWMTNDERYLVTMTPAGHGTSVQSALAGRDLYGGLAPDTTLGSEYSKALAIAFMQVHVVGDASYQPFLRAAYADYISTEPIALEMVQSLTIEQLEAAFGAPSPIPPRPDDVEP